MRQFATISTRHEWAEQTLIAAKRPLGAKVARLRRGDEAQALEFLKREPLKNVTLIGSIDAHGVEDEQHRGSFYGYFTDGRIDGLALIGHWVLLSGGERAIEAFADAARAEHREEVAIVLGEEFAVEMFDRLFTAPPSTRTIRQTHSQCLFTIREIDGDDAEEGVASQELRLAETSEVDEVLCAHALACMEIHGFDKEALDPQGFRQRLLKRVEMKSVWITRDERGVAFKCDVVMMTDEAFYLEGLWTRPDMRSHGYSNRIMRALCRKLLQQRPAVCLFADASNERVTSFYRRVGFENLAPFRLTWYDVALDESARKMQ